MAADKVSHFLPDKGVRMEGVDEKRHDAEEPEGSAKSQEPRAIPADGEGINPDTGRLPRMELLLVMISTISDILRSKEMG